MSHPCLNVQHSALSLGYDPSITNQSFVLRPNSDEDSDLIQPDPRRMAVHWLGIVVSELRTPLVFRR